MTPETWFHAVEVGALLLFGAGIWRGKNDTAAASLRMDLTELKNEDLRRICDDLEDLTMKVNGTPARVTEIERRINHPLNGLDKLHHDVMNLRSSVGSLETAVSLRSEWRRPRPPVSSS